MNVRLHIVIGAAALLVLLPCSNAADIDCGFYNEIEITDPAGDATPGAPPYVDILGLRLRQFGNKVHIEWVSNGNPNNYDFEWFVLLFDTDRDPSTGASDNGLGVDLKIGVYHDSYIHRFDADGTWILNETGPPVVFGESGFFISLDFAEIGASSFDIFYHANGPWYDSGSVHRITLQPPRNTEIAFEFESDSLALTDNPPLLNISNRGSKVGLGAVIVTGEDRVPLPKEDVAFHLTHTAWHVIQDPTAIISVNSDDEATYHDEGWVVASATAAACGQSVGIGPAIIATGDIFGDPETDSVVAVFPSDYAPEDSPFTFGDMMTSYPNYMDFVNTAYRVTSDLYRGYTPFNGDTQVFALLDLEGHCGGNGNPLETSPCCYMNCGDGSPQYNVVIHEMGHNFGYAKGLRLLSEADGRKLGVAGLGECSASLPIIYFEQEVVQYGGKYGVLPGSFEHQYYTDNIAHYCPNSQGQLEAFESDISDGTIEGVFDQTGDFDRVSVFCSFFQMFSCGYVNGPNPYRHQLVRRLLNVFSDHEIPDFQEDKVDTYFSAAYSAAAGRDMRDKLRFWGFDIDDAFYDEIMPMIESRIELFSDRFEFGDLHKWSAVQQ